jgi:hypothetical protein
MDLKDLLQQTTINKNPTHFTDVKPEPEPEPEPEVILESEGTLEPEPELENSGDDRFKLPWNKLEKGMKMNRILIYVDSQKKEYSLSDNQTKDLKNILFRGCENGLFNKINDVKYDEEQGLIESFKQLEFNESSKKYKLKSSGNKNRSVSKSRSNIDRLMKKR